MFSLILHRHILWLWDYSENGGKGDQINRSPRSENTFQNYNCNCHKTHEILRSISPKFIASIGPNSSTSFSLTLEINLASLKCWLCHLLEIGHAFAVMIWIKIWFTVRLFLINKIVFHSLGNWDTQLCFCVGERPCSSAGQYGNTIVFSMSFTLIWFPLTYFMYTLHTQTMSHSDKGLDSFRRSLRASP